MLKLPSDLTALAGEKWVICDEISADVIISMIPGDGNGYYQLVVHGRAVLGHEELEMVRAVGRVIAELNMEIPELPTEGTAGKIASADSMINELFRIQWDVREMRRAAMWEAATDYYEAMRQAEVLEGEEREIAEHRAFAAVGRYMKESGSSSYAEAIQRLQAG
jgi:hypothetical protein